MADINSLPLIAEQAPPEDIGNLPEPVSFGPALQPGPVKFTLPLNIKDVWGVFQTTDQGQKIEARFEKDNRLIAADGSKFKANVNNRTRKISDVTVSDLGLLLQAVGYKGILSDNKSYALALNGFGGKEFWADADLTASCRNDKDIYGKEGEKVSGTMGCGTVYQTYLPKKARTDGKPVKLIPMVDNKYAEKFECSCGAVLRAFNNIRNFRASK